MRFRYHQPIPNFYQIENPSHPKTTISDDFLNEFRDIAIASRFAGLSYAKLDDEFKKEWDIDWDNIIILKYAMSEGILKMEPSKDKCRLMDEEFQEVGAKTFALADILRENGFRADLINPPRSNMCLFREGLNLGFFMIETSIENLPFKTENEMDWVKDHCLNCGVCIDRCPEKVFDEDGKFIRKLCTAHREGCSNCINYCPFYKKGYDKVKERYLRMKK